MPKTLPVGTRVRFKQLTHSTLSEGGEGPILGVVTGYDRLGYSIVRLDRPATYGSPGDTFTCAELTGDADTLEVVPSTESPSTRNEKQENNDARTRND